jgi:hypothetical protein
MKSGIGAACGLRYLMGGHAEEAEREVKIMAASLTGMICNGAKAGCALKVSISADMATRAAMLAMRRADRRCVIRGAGASPMLNGQLKWQLNWEGRDLDSWRGCHFFVDTHP